jgi:hypothetical protein
MARKIYLGNNPASPEYDSNVPAGWNKWDAGEDWSGYEEEDPPEEEIEEPLPPIENNEDE